jgi:hypothetical protein
MDGGRARRVDSRQLTGNAGFNVLLLGRSRFPDGHDTGDRRLSLPVSRAHGCFDRKDGLPRTGQDDPLPVRGPAQRQGSSSASSARLCHGAAEPTLARNRRTVSPRAAGPFGSCIRRTRRRASGRRRARIPRISNGGGSHRRAARALAGVALPNIGAGDERAPRCAGTRPECPAHVSGRRARMVQGIIAERAARRSCAPSSGGEGTTPGPRGRGPPEEAPSCPNDIVGSASWRGRRTRP